MDKEIDLEQVLAFYAYHGDALMLPRVLRAIDSVKALKSAYKWAMKNGHYMAKEMIAARLEQIEVD